MPDATPLSQVEVRVPRTLVARMRDRAATEPKDEDYNNRAPSLSDMVEYALWKVYG